MLRNSHNGVKIFDSMSVEEAILELLKVHNRVILPGFGAFLVAKDDAAEKPYVLFNGFLSFNDGLLIDYLAEKNGVDNVVAADYGAEYVFNLKAHLQEEKIYKFNFLGTFDFDESGGMRFRYNPNIGRVPQKPGAHAKPTAKVEPKKEVKAEKRSDELKESPKSVKPTESKIEAIPDVPAKSTPSITDDLLNIDNSTSPSVVIDSVPSSTGSSKIDSSKSSFELEEEKPSTPIIKPRAKEIKVDISEPQNSDSSETRAEGRGRVIFAVVSILLVFIFVGGYFYFYYLPNKAEVAARQELMELAIKQKEERIKIQSDSLAAVRVCELALADSLRLEEDSKTFKPGFHLIIGAFAEEKNADKLLVKVQNSFPKAHKLVYKGRYMVCVENSSSIAEARAKQENVLKTLSTDCWIHKD